MADTRIDELILDKLDKLTDECEGIREKVTELREDFVEHQSASKVYMEIDSEKSTAAEESLKKLDDRLQALEDERTEQKTIQKFRANFIKKTIIVIGLIGTIVTILYRLHII